MRGTQHQLFEQHGLFRSSFTPGLYRVQPCNCCDGVVVMPVSPSPVFNGQKVIGHFPGPDAFANASAFVDWHNAQQEAEAAA